MCGRRGQGTGDSSGFPGGCRAGPGRPQEPTKYSASPHLFTRVHTYSSVNSHREATGRGQEPVRFFFFFCLNHVGTVTALSHCSVYSLQTRVSSRGQSGMTGRSRPWLGLCLRRQRPLSAGPASAAQGHLLPPRCPRPEASPRSAPGSASLARMAWNGVARTVFQF